ncbi:MAG: DJ-1/PfpI family protein [Oscillochloris sp.]|nr:DJ-1/PfpI family protein [Oscillochloris sp.]
MQQRRVGIVIFADVEVLDVCGPFEVFTTTRLDEAQRRESPGPYEVLLVAEQLDPVQASGGLRMLPNVTLADCPPLDLLLVPGGWGTRPLLERPSVLSWINQRGQQGELLAGVCTGSMLLGQAGLLDGHRATTHWRSLDWMHSSFPNVTVVRDEHVVEAGRILTSAGISAGIDLALRIVARQHGEAIARATARHMEYPYPESNARRIDGV